jgi:hypothetical protein
LVVSKATVLYVVVVVLFFFLSPVILWFNDSSLLGNGNPIYHSPGCAAFGLGDEYAPDWFGFRLGCKSPTIFP